MNEVVGVGGTGAVTWPRALLDDQSTYRPPWIATNVTALDVLRGLRQRGESLPRQRDGLDPGVVRLRGVDGSGRAKVRRHHSQGVPVGSIAARLNPNSPLAASSGSDTTYAAVEAACQDLAIFAKIADAAGKNLTVASFTKAGYQLRNVTFPGSGGPVSFGPGQPYAIGKVNMVSITLGPACWCLLLRPESKSSGCGAGAYSGRCWCTWWIAEPPLACCRRTLLLDGHRDAGAGSLPLPGVIRDRVPRSRGHSSNGSGISPGDGARTLRPPICPCLLVRAPDKLRLAVSTDIPGTMLSIQR